jgi:uncharacterized protein with NAD-binding domain and iron-sulfur cluster
MNPERIVIIGGGMSGLVTAWELTSLPDWKSRYTITLLQQGWRLGGKGASGRGVDDRIEEHGLHVLFGFYENAFRILRRVYEEVRRKPGEPASVFDMLEPQTELGAMEQIDGEWHRWDVPSPPRPGRPGDGPMPLTIAGVVGRVMEIVHGLLPDLLSAAEGFARFEVHFADVIGLVQTVRAQHLTSGGTGGVERLITLLESVHRWLRDHLTPSTVARRARIMIDILLALGLGALRDGLLFPTPDWFRVDDEDFRDWLGRHGASPETLASAPVKAFYDQVFTPPKLAAGTMAHILLTAISYRGAAFYKMRAGMGDTIFAPLYRVLCDRGVTFRFFHRVESIEPSADGTRIERLLIDRQAPVTQEPYRPLRTIHDLETWPSEPDWSQLAMTTRPNFEDWWDPWRGEPLTWTVGTDFDRVVLAASVGVFPHLCEKLLADASKPEFARMVDAVKTTQTQGVQLWLRKPVLDLGWLGRRPTVIPFAEPFDTWAEMGQVLRSESHAPGTVLGLTYHCSSLEDDETGPLPPRTDHDYSKRQHARVRAYAETWIADNAAILFPKARTIGGGFDWSVLFAPAGKPHPLDEQFWIATNNPSDRYVWPVPGSSAKRLPAHRSGWSNLVLAGDWTLTAISAGCLEAATMGGIAAARAIDPRVPRAVHDWLPDTYDPATSAGGAVPSPSSAGPPYRTRDGEMLVPPPVTIHVKEYMFVVGASWPKLQALCDAHLNIGGPRRYTALPFVVFYCADMDNETPWGSVAERDFGVWLPVVATEGAVPIPRGLLVYTPYIWVDNSPAAVGGRLVFGFPKHVARLTMPQRPLDAPRFQVDGWGVVREGGRAEELPLMWIARPDTAGKPSLVDRWASLWNGSSALLAGHESALSGLLAGVAGIPDWLGLRAMFEKQLGLSMVFLKEFPAAAGPIDAFPACYQAIVEAMVRTTAWHGAGPYAGPWEVGLFDGFSHHTALNLGLRDLRWKPDALGRQYAIAPVIAGAWASFDAVVEPASSVWEAPRPRGA